MTGGTIGHLLCWERHERDGSWWAWVSWIQGGSTRPVHKVVAVTARTITPIEAPAAYDGVPRRVLRTDGTVRNLQPPVPPSS